MIEIKLNEDSAEDVKAIQELREMGVPDDVIQMVYDNTQKKRENMNVFDILRENINKKKEYFQKFYEAEGKTEADEYLNKATQLAFDDAVEIVNQVEQFRNDTLKLNIDDKKPSAEELAEHLQMHMDLFTFNPSTGEDLEPWQMNELDRDLYTTMYHAKKLLESVPKPLTYDKVKCAQESSYVKGWNDCLEKIMGEEG